MTIKYTIFLLSLSFILQPENAFANPVDVQSMYTKLQQQGVKYFTDIHTEDGEYDWKLLIHSNKGTQFLSIFDKETNKLVFQYSLQGPMDGFIYKLVLDWEGYPPMIASVWRRGVHGEQFVLLDPLNQKVLYKLTSAWPLSIQECGRSLAITLSGQTDTEGNPIQETHYWHSPDLIEITKGDGSGCMPTTEVETIQPIDDSSFSLSLSKFLKIFDTAVKNKDFTAIKNFTSTQILNSFGGAGGIDEFILIWKNNQDGLFETLSQIRKGGGRLTRDKDGTELYCLPRMFTDFPKDLNAFTYGVLVGEDVPIYAEPDKKSRVLTKLSHAVVGIDDWVEEKKIWQPIKLKQDIRGYVESNKVRSPIDYRACFVQNDIGQWKMTQLIAGD